MTSLSKKDILEYIQKYGKVQVAIVDIDGILRGKVMHADKFESILNGGFGFCDVVFGWDAADVSYENADFTGWHSGFPDASVEIDLSTFRIKSWDRNMPFLLGDFRNKEGNSLEVCPRSLLKKIKGQAEDLGYNAFFSQEFEWFTFEETPEDFQNKSFNNPKPMTPGMFGYSLLRTSVKRDFFNDLFDLLCSFEIPIEGIHTETGPGVYEAAIFYSDILEAGDRATLFKAKVKEIAHLHDLMASFMAKWRSDLPGCSGHVHQSLWNKNGKTNLFYDSKDEFGMSKLMKHYIAGQLHCLPYILPMMAPTINSYKRLVEGAWAPTTLTWGIDNRTVALRALPGSKKSTRLETRVPGSDSNPYLAMSACLAAGLYGIKNKLELKTPRTLANGYEETQNGVLPSNLWEATQKMKNSDLAKELFGEDFVKHFTQTREWEWKQFAKEVTDWEMKRYFEII